VVAPE
jgi:non-heme chloroperoxidase